jgi:hypothetical protein
LSSRGPAALRQEEERALTEAERAKVEAAFRMAEEDKVKADLQKARGQAEDLARRYDQLSGKGMTLLRKKVTGKDVDPDRAPVIWAVEPAEPRAGGTVKLFYNRKASPLAWVNIPADKVCAGLASAARVCCVCMGRTWCLGMVDGLGRAQA